jgi:hypothetical protein
VNIPEFAKSITSVQVLAERVKQSSLGRESQAIKSWQRESSKEVLVSMDFGAEQQEVLTMRVEQWRLDGRVKHTSESY